jgi:hypothetical protein
MFSNATALQDHDLIGALHSCQAMRHDHGGARRVVHQAVDRLVDQVSVAGSRCEEASSSTTSPGSLRKMRISASSCASPG